MECFISDPDLTIYVGDSRKILKQFEPDSIDCVVTSPPYFALRDYGVEGQIGLEETPEEFITELVSVFEEVHRVLAPHGSLWLNLGDSYAGGGNYRGVHSEATLSAKQRTNGGARGLSQSLGARNHGVKAKDLLGIPWRVALALREDGWWLRSEIIWSKLNPMPESITDRPTKAHEHIFLLTKNANYFFDQEAVREPYEVGPGPSVAGSADGPGSHHPISHAQGKGPDGRKFTKVKGGDMSQQHRNGERWPNPNGRNMRDVWTIPTQAYAEAHFATFPEEIPTRAIKAGCPERVCVICGKPSTRILEKSAVGKKRKRSTPMAENFPRDPYNVGKEFQEGVVYETVGWTDCGHNAWRPGRVLDPFLGSGTTALVSRRLARHTVGIELNREYAEIAARRTQQLSVFA